MNLALDGLDLQQFLGNLPETLKEVLDEIAPGVRDLLSGKPDASLNEIEAGVRKLTAAIRKDLPILSKLADLIDDALDKALANPDDTALLQNLLRPVLLLINLNEGNLSGVTGLLGGIGK